MPAVVVAEAGDVTWAISNNSNDLPQRSEVHVTRHSDDKAKSTMGIEVENRAQERKSDRTKLPALGAHCKYTLLPPASWATTHMKSHWKPLASNLHWCIMDCPQGCRYLHAMR